jgi:membrane-bound inhibitor of C-type lysozyme
MTFKDKISSRRGFTRSIAIGATAIAIGGGAYGIVSATASTGSPTATATSASSATSAQHVPSSGGSNARSGPAAGGSIGKVSSVSTSGFKLLTATGEKVTVKETSSTKYEKGTNSASMSAVTKGKTALVLGTIDNTTITATQVIVQPTNSGSKTASEVVPFKQGTPSTSKQVGQIPASYKQGSGTIVSGSTANKATKTALAGYPGGIVDRVVKLSNGEYEVHNIGVNWPHHIFVNQEFKVIGADD